jgi:chemotaxis protein histidine kinase CheA
MTVIDAFAERLARVRHRFVSSLAGKIDDACAAIATLSDIAPAPAAAVGEAYRTMHGMVGIGPTVGFPATGRAARSVEDILRAPYHEGRGLSADEISLLTNALNALREAASCELQSCHLVGE